MQRLHDIVPDRRRAHHAAHVAHRLVVGVSGPYADDQVGTVAHRPVVAPVGGSAGFGRCRTRDAQWTPLAEGRCSGEIVA